MAVTVGCDPSAKIPRRDRVGFIGLGVMGGPMCRHLHEKQEVAGFAGVLAYDIGAAGRAVADAAGIPMAQDLGDLSAACDIIHVCLPGGPQLSALCNGPGGLLAVARAGQVIVDHGTSPVGLTRSLHDAFAKRDIVFCDAPITRTRAAAEAGTLVVLFGGQAGELERVRPAIACFAETIFHCGGVGAGQVVKQMNNMVLIQTVVAIGEALATARAAGVDGDVLFSALEAGSGDSFALRNHGRKSMLPGVYPERAFSTSYALKDLDYALDLAQSVGLPLAQAKIAHKLLSQTKEAGFADNYWPAVYEIIASSRTKS